MVKNHCLAKAVGWGEFVRQLEYKSQWYGRTAVSIDRWYPSSKTCYDCKHVVDDLPLDVREWVCPKCGVSHDRDINAARNILADLGVCLWRRCQTRSGETSNWQPPTKQESSFVRMRCPCHERHGEMSLRLYSMGNR